MSWVSSLSNRIFLASALLAVLSIATAIFVVNRRVTEQAEWDLEQGLTEAGMLVELYRRQTFEHVTREARMIADLPKLKAAVDTKDPPTVKPLADDYSARINADLFLVTDRTGRVLAQSGNSPMSGAEVSGLAAIRRATQGGESSSFWPTEKGILQVVTVPILITEPPEILGTLSVGVWLNDKLAEEFKRMTDSEIAFTANGVTQASTLPTEQDHVIAAITPRTGERPAHITIGGNEYVALARNLEPVSTATVGAAEVDNRLNPVAVILRSRSERLRFLNRLHTLLAATALLAVTLAVGISYAVARTVTRPLAAITASMREMGARGDLSHKIELPDGALGVDADARLLANTFNSMIESISRAQREAAQRERLSSLGRLSTVVAHEIRNPLMIIKTSLRILKRGLEQRDQAPEASGAIQDIEEELVRLNRIVTEVLDFARPIRFDMAPADLNAVCKNSVAAATPELDDEAVKLLLDPELPPLLTDAERLRLALVNILLNARHALEARGHAEPADHWRIKLATSRTPTGVLIVIGDRGAGIAQNDLPHVFEPYFTTKRTGSGLGLAIAKNIIEGLGGTLAVLSQAGIGTEVRIELPLAPARTSTPAAPNQQPMVSPGPLA